MSQSCVERARMLLGAANINAITLSTSLAKRYPQWASVDEADWDFFVTVAGVGTAFAMIADCVPSGEQQRVSEIVAQELREWQKQGYAGLEDFLAFAKKNTDAGVELPLAIGSWIVWNLKKEPPNREELEVAGAIGLSLIQTFARWWIS